MMLMPPHPGMHPASCTPMLSPCRARPPQTRCSSRCWWRRCAAPCPPASAGAKVWAYPVVSFATEGLGAQIADGSKSNNRPPCARCLEPCTCTCLPACPTLRPAAPSRSPARPRPHRVLVVGVVLRHHDVEHGAGVAHLEHLAAGLVHKLAGGGGQARGAGGRGGGVERYARAGISLP